MSVQDSNAGAPAGPGWARCVLLRHELPDGSWHFDWLFEASPGGPLVSFRVMEVPGGSAVGFEAFRSADHRPQYLTYEGEVGGGRGRVAAERRGRCIVECAAPGEVSVLLDWGEGPRRVVGRAEEARGDSPGSRWRFVRADSAAR